MNGLSDRLMALLRFIWDFVVGDDWRIAAGVTTALITTALLSDIGVGAWWLLAPAVAAMLTVSVMAVARRR